jgi:hypothetical protein
MSDWKGCRGLDPAIAAQVTNAMPPCAIAMEAMSKHPFSATNPASWPLENKGFDGTSDIANDHSLLDNAAYDRLTCFEILTLRLIEYVKAQTDQGLIITDEMLQRQARHIMYGSDDTWNQTVADNREWLDLFKRAHGLDSILGLAGVQSSGVLDDTKVSDVHQFFLVPPPVIKKDRDTAILTKVYVFLHRPNHAVLQNAVSRMRPFEMRCTRAFSPVNWKARSSYQTTILSFFETEELNTCPAIVIFWVLAPSPTL